ncbi:MAG: RdgB/HAM1 family non-canonical purine NTP pyrophosphatase [Ruminococcaceae bacterium]|nr:RdgB/HAM1 family non-canonical purine NTP pyrophosphatase [Oscillospiraceae bacterium]
MKIVLASHNQKKIKELREILAGYIPDVEILSLDDVGLTEEIEESGTTFAENAFIKAHAAATSGYIGVGDDSGLEVYALDRAPGIYSARYSGEHGDDEANNRLLLHNLANKQDRSGAFVCCIACVFPEDLTRGYYFEGRTEGEIINEYRGDGGFGYDPLFYYPPMDKTYAEMTAEQKNSISHRGKAMKLLVDFLVQHTNKD